MNNSWFKKAIFYQIYPSSFKDTNGDGIGDLKGITSKIPYLQSLGINAVWINPFFESPFMDGGYDVSNFFKIDKRFGIMKDFNVMLSKFHEANIKVVIDLVPGHASEKNQIFLESAKAKNNYYTDMFVWSRNCWENPNEYKFISGRYQRNGNYMVNFFSTQPALNYGFNEITQPWQISYLDERVKKTKEYLINIIEFWINKGVDGFRVDMADSLVKNDENKDATSALWRDIFSRIRPKYPNICFISEWSSPIAITKAKFDADFMLNHPFNPFNQLLRLEEQGGHSVFDKDAKGDLKTYIINYMNWYNQIKDKGLIGNITCNHDFDRPRPRYTIRQCKIIIPYLIFLPGVPFIYYGDEIGMKFISGMANIEGGYSRTGTRIPMYWDNTPNHGFSTSLPFIKQYQSKDCVSMQEADNNSLLKVVKNAIKIRKEYLDFESSDIEFLSHDYPIIIKRKNLLIITNPLNKDIKIDLNLKDYKIIFSVGTIKNNLVSKYSILVFKK